MAATNRLIALALGVGVLITMLLGAAPATAQGYVVQGGDSLRIEVLEDESLNRDVLVTPDGTFSFPFAGTVQASGRTPAQISSVIADRIASNFAAPPNVFVGVRSLRPDDQTEEADVVRVYFLGEVNAPGAKQLVPGVTLLQALSEAGGFTNFAARKRLQLRRTDPNTGMQSVSVINYQALANGAALSRDILLTEGDVILVPQRRLFE
jgi:polysaccharide export outer membrane protein